MDFSKIPSPCYVLDEKRLCVNLKILDKIRQETGISILLALKGFAMWASFPLLKNYLNGASASSYNEARLCVDTMKTLAHSYAVAFSPQEFSKIKAFSSHIIFNSLSEFEKCTPSVFQHKKHKISCGLRVNIEFSVIENPKNDPSHRGSRLGVDLKYLKNGLPKGLEGLHIHCLCDSSAEITAQFLDAIDEKLNHFLPQLKWLNLGGGHLITQKNYDFALLTQALKAFQLKYPNLHLIFELGTAIVWEAGFLRAEVLDIVDNHGVKTLMTDISFTAHLPDILNFGMKPRILNAQLGNHSPFVYQIGGTSCLAGDFISEYSFSAPVKIGDALIFTNALPYSMVKTTHFNGVKHPSIGILQENGVFKPIRQFQYRDYKRRLG